MARRSRKIDEKQPPENEEPDGGCFSSIFLLRLGMARRSRKIDEKQPPSGSSFSGGCFSSIFLLRLAMPYPFVRSCDRFVLAAGRIRRFPLSRDQRRDR